MLKVGVTGGIGSGKSTFCNLFKELGIPVYNSDNKAKTLMTTNLELRESIIDLFGPDSYVDGELNRAFIAKKAFACKESLIKLNSLVHPCVKMDFEQWSQKQNAPYVILECAILFEAKFNDCVDRAICILSPKQLRVERVTSRDGLTVEQVEERMSNQFSDEQLHALSDMSVVNFEIEDLEDAAKVFDKKLRYEAGQN
ncbi:MAG: dephospho-CoA kinase [Rikenellaceae bacterium]